MNKILHNTAIILLLFFSLKNAYSQSLSVNDLKQGETYVITTIWTDEAHEHIVKFEKAEIDSRRKFGAMVSSHHVFGNKISIVFEKEEIKFSNFHKSNTSFTTRTFQSEWSRIRHATQEEKDWLNACIEAGEFIPKEEALKSTSKNRGQVKSEAVHLAANDRLQPGFKGRKDGFGFSGVSFNYQFVNCGGEVQMGVNIYTQHEYTVNGASYSRFLTISGYAFEGKLYPTFSYNANEVEILEVEADLYFGSVRLGKVNLDNIVGNFAGCFGETFLVIEQLGLNPKKKEYLENLDKFELKRIKVLRGDVKISEKKRQEIHHHFKYDEWGNPRKPNSKPQEKPEQKYDVFGNPIEN